VLYKLNRRVKIRRWGTVKNEFGGLVAIEVASWYKWAEVRASNWINLDMYNTRSGRPNNEYQQNKWEYDTTVILRYESERPTRSNDTIEYEGSFYSINSITVNNEYAKNFEIIKCSKVDESINNDVPMDTGNINTYNYNGIGGEFEFTFNGVIGRNLFLAFKDGVQYVPITVGDPNGKEYKFNSATGTIIWGTTFEENEEATIVYY
jgi:hypothetical protein